MRTATIVGLTLFLLAALLVAVPAVATVKVVTTLSVYASLAEEVGGERVEAQSIARGDEDAHFVKPKPSFALMLKSADLFVSTGLDLELWAPVLVDKSGNRAIRDGQPGFVSASQGVTLLDVPENASREAGDVHIYGNPHLHTSPIAAKQIAANIAAGLIRVDPDGAAVYRANLADFQRRVDEALYGKELLALLDSATLDSLVGQGKLISFLESQSLEAEPLVGKLGGWLGRASTFRGEKIIAYHKNWIYFTDLLGLNVVGYVEPKPGIPPSARHVKELIDEIAEQRIAVLVAANYFDPQKPRLIAERTGCVDVILPLGTGTGGAEDYFAMVDSWVESLRSAFERARG